MKTVSTLNRSQRGARWAAAFLFVALAALPAHARHKSEAWARTQFAKASTMQEALGGRPAADRSRREYENVIEAYRRVYFGSPTSTKAEPSVVASAELMVEMGRRFNDTKVLNAAIAQYEFLRREYPGSKYRFEALFTIGEIYKDDLDNPVKARTTFEDFIKRYPRNHLAEEARKALAEPVEQAKAKSASDDTKDSSTSDEPKSKTATKSGDESPSPPKDNKISRVTGIRHWSTPDYTRVAIDLEHEVKFDSQRISGPERIFFDLHNTRLASTLVGKSFEADDGLLQKIRVAQYQPGRTRIVLEVGELSDYHAFLLTNPPRLMIDIHGKPGAKQVKDDAGNTAGQDSSKNDVKSPAKNNENSSVTVQSDADSENDVDNQARIDSKKSPPFRTVITASGVKKTIVDADDDPVGKPKSTTAKTNSATEVAATEKAAKNVPVDSDANTSSSISESGTTVASLTTPDPVTTSDDAENSASAKPAAHSRARDTKSKTKPSSGLDVHEARPRADGDRSLIRALGLKIGKIVIDPGHGGHDTGTIGPNGLEEKDLVLDVSRRLGKLLETRLGSEVTYTRRDDTFIPLETRTAIANQEQADLFVSVHANSSHDPDARGVETYYLNFTSSPDALEVAARENAVSEKSVYELQDLVKKIALREKIEESREFAGDVESSLHAGLATKNPGLRDRGVKKAPFIVLIGANMPSILAEISFVSNPGDEKRLRTAEYRQRIAESLYRGIAKYVSGLSGVKVASRMERISDQ